MRDHEGAVIAQRQLLGHGSRRIENDQRGPWPHHGDNADGYLLDDDIRHNQNNDIAFRHHGFCGLIRKPASLDGSDTTFGVFAEMQVDGIRMFRQVVGNPSTHFSPG